MRPPSAALLAVALLPVVGAGQTSQGRGGTVASLTIFAGTDDGLERSRTWGSSWEAASGLEDAGAVHCVLPTGPRVFLCADGGLYVSEDFGETWTRVYDKSSVFAVMPSRYPLSDPTVFLGTPLGLRRSSDGGRTFEETALADAPVRLILWPGPEVVVATTRGVFLSRDAARRFDDPGRNAPAADVTAVAVSSFFAVDPVLFAGLARSGVLRSGDRGRSWGPAGLPERAVHDLVWLGPFLYAATDGGLFRTQDGGETWTPLNDGLSGREATRLLFPLAPASGAEAFLGTDAGVFWTGDGGLHWRASGLPGRRILALATFPPPEPVVKRPKQ
jgi:photosystem II stability/assembly factor-like uncharacterized protein